MAAHFLGLSCIAPPLKGPVAQSTARVLHVKLLSKGVTLQNGVAATLANVALHCATMAKCQILWSSYSWTAPALTQEKWAMDTRNRVC